ncbi:MAG: energy transducer TonB [Alphaproteobacteria bacterium]|nr:energy transducer TonB [Alphaproteobacteria bacterium]
MELLQPVAIEILQIGKETTVLAPKSEPKLKEEPKSEPPKPVEKPKSSEPKPPEPTPPAPKPEPIPKPLLESEVAPEPVPTLEPLPMPPKPKKEVKPKPKVKPKNPKPTFKKPDAKPKEDVDKDFTSVLKNLKKSKPTSSPTENVGEKDASPSTDVPSSQLGKIGSELSQSELDAVRQQVAQCWNVPVGVKEAESLNVVIYLSMNPDGSVREAKIQGGTTNHPMYQIAADSALRAIKNPLCSPLKLPLHRYNIWKEFTFTFDPKDMF